MLLATPGELGPTLVCAVLQDVHSLLSSRAVDIYLAEEKHAFLPR